MVAVLAFFGFFSVYALRVNLSVAIVAMTNRRNFTLENGTVIRVSLSVAGYTSLREHFLHPVYLVKYAKRITYRLLQFSGFVQVGPVANRKPGAGL